MRKRSEIKKTPAPKKSGKFCAVLLPDETPCGLPLYETPSGNLCHAHGGGVPEQDEPALTTDETKENVDAIRKLSEGVNKLIDNKEREEASTRRDAIRRSGDHPASWPSANRASEKPLDDRFSRIQEHLFVDDVEGTWKALEEQLRIGEDRTDRGVLLRALDNAETNARLAHRLWMTAKLEQTRYETTNKIIFGAMRDDANRMLQREKDQKLRSKQITEEDIETMSAQLFPDEFEAQTLRRKKVELMVKSFENLAELWMKRCSALESMLGKSR